MKLHSPNGRCDEGSPSPWGVRLFGTKHFVTPPLSSHVTELLAERGLAVDASCVWRWVQVYAAELNKRCRPYLKATNKNYRVDETYISKRYWPLGVSFFQTS